MFLIISFGGLQPFGDKVNVPLRGSDTRRRLLLERVKHVDRVCERYGVDGPIGVGIVFDDDLEDAGAAEAAQRLGVGMPGWNLGCIFSSAS